MFNSFRVSLTHFPQANTIPGAALAALTPTPDALPTTVPRIPHPHTHPPTLHKSAPHPRTPVGAGTMPWTPSSISVR